MDMQIRPYLIGTVLQVAIAQRLVRKLCQRCRKRSEISAEQASMLGKADLKGTPQFLPGGCTYCAGTGFVGRLGLFEFVFLDAELSRLVADHASETILAKELSSRGVATLLDDGIEKLHQGLTSFDQVATIINPF
jgi:type II secretory ATPase GspE/PulE/Tfp pilus assembly ATPase PilB-like protein